MSENLFSIEDREPTLIEIGKITVGRDFTVIAGPCAVESEDQIMTMAKVVKEAGADILRGGAFKPRTSPYSFQGLGEEGLRYLREAGDAYDIPVLSEVMDTRDVEMVATFVDVLQVGARNMQNFSLLEELGKIDKPILLKRGMWATVDEWLYAAEYILKAGNPNVILCERGIRTGADAPNNTLDLNALAAARKLTHLPILSDPAHGSGRWDLIEPLSLAAIMAGAQGLEIEVHPEPKEAYSDAGQQLYPDQFEALMKKVRRTVEFRESL